MINCYNRKALDELLAYYHPEVRFWHTLLDGEVRGLRRFGEVIGWIFTEFPDEIVTMDALIGDDAYAVGEFRSTGTRASGEPFQLESTEVYKLVDGLITELLVYLNSDRLPDDSQAPPAVPTCPRSAAQSDRELMPDSPAARLLEEFRARYVAGDVEGTLALIAPDADVRFLGRPDAHGVEALRLFVGRRREALDNLECRFHAVIDDGDATCALWNEQGATEEGEVWSNHGVFVARADRNSVVTLHVSSALAPF